MGLLSFYFCADKRDINKNGKCALPKHKYTIYRANSNQIMVFLTHKSIFSKDVNVSIDQVATTPLAKLLSSTTYITIISYFQLFQQKPSSFSTKTLFCFMLYKNCNWYLCRTEYDFDGQCLIVTSIKPYFIALFTLPLLSILKSVSVSVFLFIRSYTYGYKY